MIDFYSYYDVLIDLAFLFLEFIVDLIISNLMFFLNNSIQ